MCNTRKIANSPIKRDTYSCFNHITKAAHATKPATTHHNDLTMHCHIFITQSAISPNYLPTPTTSVDEDNDGGANLNVLEAGMG